MDGKSVCGGKKEVLESKNEFFEKKHDDVKVPFGDGVQMNQYHNMTLNTQNMMPMFPGGGMLAYPNMMQGFNPYMMGAPCYPHMMMPQMANPYYGMVPNYPTNFKNDDDKKDGE